MHIYGHLKQSRVLLSIKSKKLFTQEEATSTFYSRLQHGAGISNLRAREKYLAGAAEATCRGRGSSSCWPDLNTETHCSIFSKPLVGAGYSTGAFQDLQHAGRLCLTEPVIAGEVIAGDYPAGGRRPRLSALVCQITINYSEVGGGAVGSGKRGGGP